ncbi:MAG: hypothetical protein WKF93_07300 [Acidimicrobiales bacterium]
MNAGAAVPALPCGEADSDVGTGLESPTLLPTLAVADDVREVAMRPEQFYRCLATLQLDDIMEVAAALREQHATADGEVAHWRAELAVAAALRRTHQQRAAGLAAHRAGAAVLAAAAWSRVGDEGRADVVAVARAAAEAARALVSGYPDARCSGRARPLLRPWQGVISRAGERHPPVATS